MPNRTDMPAGPSETAVPKTALLFGASGLVGNSLLHALLNSGDYSAVTVWVRKPLDISHSLLRQHCADFSRLAHDLPQLAADDIFCCLGTTIRNAGSREAFKQVDLEYPVRIAEWAGRSGAFHYLVISSMGADAGSRIFYSRVKGLMEAGVSASAVPAVHCFRPSLLLGDRREFRIGERIGSYAARALQFAMVGPLRKYRPIPAATVALSMLAAARDPRAGRFVHDSEELSRMAAGLKMN